MTDDKVYNETLAQLREWGYDFETAHEIAVKRAVAAGRR